MKENMIWFCKGPGEAYGGVEEIEWDKEYYLFQVYAGIHAEDVIERRNFETQEGFRVEFDVLDDPDIIRHTRIIIRSISISGHKNIQSTKSGSINKNTLQVRVPCKNGTLVAEAGGNPDFPEIFTYLERPDGTQIDLVAAGADLPGEADGSHKGGIHAYLYGDTSKDEWTKRHLFTENELEIRRPQYKG